MPAKVPTSKIIRFPRRKPLTADELADAVFRIVPLAKLYENYVRDYCRHIRKK